MGDRDVLISVLKKIIDGFTPEVMVDLSKNPIIMGMVLSLAAIVYSEIYSQFDLHYLIDHLFIEFLLKEMSPSELTNLINTTIKELNEKNKNYNLANMSDVLRLYEKPNIFFKSTFNRVNENQIGGYDIRVFTFQLVHFLICRISKEDTPLAYSLLEPYLNMFVEYLNKIGPIFFEIEDCVKIKETKFDKLASKDVTKFSTPKFKLRRIGTFSISDIKSSMALNGATSFFFNLNLSFDYLILNEEFMYKATDYLNSLFLMRTDFWYLLEKGQFCHDSKVDLDINFDESISFLENDIFFFFFNKMTGYSLPSHIITDFNRSDKHIEKLYFNLKKITPSDSIIIFVEDKNIKINQEKFSFLKKKGTLD